MDNRPARTARGLSIATLVVSILSIAAAIMVFITLIGAAIYFDAQIEERDLTPEAALEEVINQTPELKQAFEESDIDITSFDEELFATAILLGMAMVCGLYMASIICALVASILGITRAKDPKRYTAAQVWAILAAVFSGIIALMCGGALILRLATMVLCIIMAVYESKARKFANAAGAYQGFHQPYGGAPYGGAPVGYSPQPYGYQPQQQGYANTAAQTGYAQNGYQQPYQQNALPPFTQQPQAQAPVQSQGVPQGSHAPASQGSQVPFEPEQYSLDSGTSPTDGGETNASQTDCTQK